MHPHTARRKWGHLLVFPGPYLVLACWMLLTVARGWHMPGAVAGTPALCDDYAIEVWRTNEGLPQNSITSIAQTPDGYLWLATFGGLARFDGVRFTVFDDHNAPALTSSRLVRLDPDGQGGLWVISEAGGLAHMLNSQFTAYTGREGWPKSGASAVGRARDGRVWLRDKRGGLHRLEEGWFAPVGDLQQLGSGPLSSFGFDEGGVLWLRRGRTLSSYQGGKYIPLRTPDGTSEAVVRAVGSCARGGLVLITSQGLQKFRRGQWEPGNLPCPAELRNLTFVYEDRSGAVWVGTYGNGLFRYDDVAGWRRFTAGSGLGHNAVRSVCEDREGNLWVGTDGGGLYRLKARRFHRYEARDGLSGDVVMSVSEGPCGVFWFGVNGGGVSRFEAGRFTALAPTPQLATNAYVYSVLADRAGNLWIGTYDHGLLRYRQDRLQECRPADGTVLGAVRTLFEDHAGVIWVGGADGLWRIEGDHCVRFAVHGEPLTSEVHALAGGRLGGLFVGTDGDGLYWLHENRLTHLTERDGLADNHVSALCVTADGTVWIGGSCGGLSRLQQGRLDRYSRQSGLLSDRIRSILEDDHGWLWFGCERGIFRVSRTELDEVTAGRRASVSCHTYGASDGLSGLECSGSVHPACWKAHDGTLWFATVKGVVVVDSTNLATNALPPPVVIEEVEADSQVMRASPTVAGDIAGGARVSLPTLRFPAVPPRAGAAAPELRVPPGKSRVGFHYTGLSLVAPEQVRFRHRLEGYDRGWVEAGNQRVAWYTGIPPGRYSFQVTACNNDGVWNDTGAALAVVVQPAWWQTWWFHGVAAAAAAGGVLGSVEARLRRLRRGRAAQQGFSRRLLESQEDERKRIAAELHDSLGQDLLVIKNRALLGLQDPAATTLVADQLGEISRLASHTLEEVREISRNLRPYQLDRLGLTKALQAMVTSVSRASGIPIATDLDPVDGLLPAAMEIHFYRIVQELLSNLVKHSHASAARVALSRCFPRLTLMVEDDGCGFDTDMLPHRQARAGLGLTDIAERVRLLGGTARCDSRPAAGTRWTVEIPVTTAPPP